MHMNELHERSSNLYHYQSGAFCWILCKSKSVDFFVKAEEKSTSIYIVVDIFTCRSTLLRLIEAIDPQRRELLDRIGRERKLWKGIEMCLLDHHTGD